MMRTLLFVLTFLLSAQTLSAQIISQYYEGSSSNKWIEIYNPTSSPINLSGLYLALYSNPTSNTPTGSPNNSTALTGTLAAGATLLFQNSSAALPTYASGTNSSACNFNGDDIVILSSSNGASSFTDRIDMIGSGAPGTPNWGANESWVRFDFIVNPNTSFSVGEWMVVSNATVDGAAMADNEYLGTHNLSVPLPVTLTAFNAKLTNQGAMLEWTTASEENNDYFAVEMSRDATRFSESAKVSGNGTTESLETYTYEYNNLTSGTYYFRLRQVDFDGQSTYSDVVTLTVEGDRDFLMVNNAVQDIAVIDVTTPRAVRILNMAGAVVAEHDLQAGRNNLDVSDLANGMYILSDGNKAKRFVK